MDVNQEQIFDRFADDYDLLLGDWENDLKDQAHLLDRFFCEATPDGIQEVLDCMCGIGTQAIGLALRGYRVTGTDISGRAVARARREAERFGVNVCFEKADVRRLDQTVSGRFDAVISCDNSLSALMSDADVEAAVRQMHARCKASGLCVISIRDFDAVFREKKRLNPRHVHEAGNQRVVVFDLWDYPEPDVVKFNVFYLSEGEAGWAVRCREMVYRAIYRDRLVPLLKDVGFAVVDVVSEIDGRPLPFDYYLCRNNG